MVPNNACRMLLSIIGARKTRNVFQRGGVFDTVFLIDWRDRSMPHNIAVSGLMTSESLRAIDHALYVQALSIQAFGGSARSLKASQTMWSRISPGQPAMSSTKRRRSSANNA